MEGQNTMHFDTKSVVKVPDQIPLAKPAVDASKLMVSPRISKSEAIALKARGYAAISFYGPIDVTGFGPLGEAAVVRPILPKVTTSFNDTIANKMDKNSWLAPHRLFVRVWFFTKSDARFFFAEQFAHLLAIGKPIRHDWYDIGTTDLSTLHANVLALAKALGLETLSDQDVLKSVQLKGLTIKSN